MKSRKRYSSILLFLFTLLLFGITSCSRYKVATTLRMNNLKSYTGPLKPKDTVGYLTSASDELAIAEIDGITISQLQEQTKHEGGFSYVELMPGKHTILVEGSTFHTSRRGFHTNLTVDVSSLTRSTRGSSELSLLVEAGHVYVIKSKITKSKKKEDESRSVSILTIYIKDVVTGDIVCQVDSEIQRL
ncbi:MAG: hypothetical protein JW755_10805 [Candidatus Aminicenantes bacterium]|nr:hypothetical protein [Candidatus Aminicenantes bacterium]